MKIGGRTLFVEPAEGHSPNAQGHHLHVVHPPKGREGACGVNDTASQWDEAMKERFE